MTDEDRIKAAISTLMASEWWQHRMLWLGDCLSEYNEEFAGSLVGYKKYHQDTCPDDYEAGDLVEFGDDGTAYPHGIGGTTYIRKAVTPWTDSPHYMP